jgi:hypothetical protein
LRIQQDVDDVFLDAIDGRVLVQHAGDRHFGGGETRHGRQQDAAQCITQGVAISTLKRLERHFGTVGAKLLNIDGFGF